MTSNSNKNRIPFYQTWMTIVYDKHLRIVDVINPQHCMLLQLTADVLLGMSVSELEEVTEGPNKEPARIIAKNVRLALREDRNVYFEYSTTHKDNSVTYAICYAEKGGDDLLYVNVLKIDEENIFEARDGFTNYVINATMNNISVGVYMRHMKDDGTKSYILFNDVAKEFYESADIQQSKHWNQQEEDLADEKAMELRDPLKIEKVFRDEDGNIIRWLVITKKKITSRAKGFYIVTTIIDITKRRQNEILLEQQFALLDSMYEHIPVGIVIYDKNGRLVSLNKKEMDMLGVQDKEHIVGKNIFDDPNTPEGAKLRLKSGENVEYEVTYDFDLAAAGYFQTHNSGKRIFSVKSAVIKNKKNDIDGYLQICEDITEKKNIEKRLWRKHQLIETIYNTIPIGVELYDKEGCLLEINKHDMQMMGVEDKKTVLGTNLFDDPNTPDDIKEKTRSGESVGYTLEYDFDLARNKYYDAHIAGKKFIDVKTSVLHDDQCNIDGYLLVSQDRTESVERERLLEETATKFSSMFDAMSNGVEIYDRNGILIDCNESDLRIFGLENKEDLIRSRISIYDNPNVTYEHLKSLLKGDFLSLNINYDFDVVRQCNYYPTSKTGCITIEVKFSPMYVNRGEFIGYVAEVNDVTLAIENELKLTNTQRDLELALSAGSIAAWTFDVATKTFYTLYGNAIAGEKLTWDDNLKMLHSDDANHLSDVFQPIITGEADKMSTILRYHADDVEGGYRYYESSMIGVKKAGVIRSINGTQKEITDDVLMKQELEEAHRKSSLVIDNLISGMVYLDTGFTVIWENLRALNDHPRANGYKVGRKCYETAFGRTSPCENCIVEKVKSCGQRSTMTEFEDNGMVLNITADTVKNQTGETVGFICRLDDVTESYNHKVELERGREDLNLALEAGQVAAWTYDIANRMFYTLQGDALAGDGISMDDNHVLLHPDDRQMQIDLFASIARGERVTASTIFRYMHPDGKYHHFESRMIAKKYKGKIAVITGTQKDITEQIEYQQNLVRLKEEALSANQILNQVLDNMPGMLYVKDSSHNYRFVLANKNFCRYVGRTYEEVVGHKDSEMLSTENANKWGYDYYDRLVVESNQAYSYDDCVMINGKLQHWHIIKSPLKMSNGDVYTVGIATDITAIKDTNIKLERLQKEALNSNQILNEIIDRIPGGVYIKDASGDFAYIKANRAFCEIAGKTQSQMVGRNDFEIFHPELAERYRYYDMKLVEGELQTVSYESEVLNDSHHGHWQINKSIVTTQDNCKLILGIATDITKFREINKELQIAKEEAEQSDKLKSAFLANMSHEIRTPLNAIVGFSELLQTTDDKRERAEFMSIINQNNELLLRLIGDILDLSKIESGLIELKLEKFDMSATFCETFASLKARCTNPEVEFLGVNPYKKCIVKLDKNRMLQVGTNFVTNAMKYTPKGQIIMGYEYIDEGLRIYVKDTGIGIPKEKQPLLFQRFAKLDDFAQGTGLGLAISKAIIDAKGGKIGVESEEGKGSTFWAWMPCKAIIDDKNTEIQDHCSASVKEKPAAPPRIDAEKKLSILIAEDNDSNYMLVKAILKQYVLTRAINGAIAVDLASKKKYDAILMDMKMPVMNGLEATRLIRGFDDETPIIALTANAFDSDKVDALKAGCNAFISKPLKKKELEDILKRFRTKGLTLH